MYGGKLISGGDPVFIFDSENEGGSGLVAMAEVITAQPLEESLNSPHASCVPRTSTMNPRISIFLLSLLLVLVLLPSVLAAS